MQAHTNADNSVQWSTFGTENGCAELFITLRTRPGSDFPEALEELSTVYAATLDTLGLSGETAIFSRLFVCDIVNQKQLLGVSPLLPKLRMGALSIIEQTPAGGGPASLFSYHIRTGKNGLVEKRPVSSPGEWANSLLVKGAHYSLLWTANYSDAAQFDVYSQTRTVFGSLTRQIQESGMNLLDNAIRTWVYVRDVDNHYKGMVRARRELFTSHGLTEKTRYLASTGILGQTFSPERIVTVDSLSMGGIGPEQIVRMEAPAHLSPTILYGVTFERGLRVRFGDRSHLYISGTASIDNSGEVLFPGDVPKQTLRTIENIRALLAEQGASLSDLAYVIIYVRNIHYRDMAAAVIEREFGGGVPFIFVEAAVCRPAWLVEIEGMAVIRDNNDFPPFL